MPEHISQVYKRACAEQELDRTRIPIEGRNMQRRSPRAHLEAVHNAPRNHAQLERLGRIVAVHRIEAILEALDVVARRCEVYQEGQ